MAEPITEEAFRKMCEAHDLTYDYSDDYSAYRRGREQYAAIKEAAEKLPRGRAVAIWNETVDKKLTDSRTGYYWR